MGPIFLHAHNKTSQNFYVFRPFDFQARCPSTAHLLRLGKAIEFFESFFYDIMTTQYDHPRYVKHVLAHINVVYTLFIPYFGCVLLGIDSLQGGLAEGNRIFAKHFFDIVTTYNNEMYYVKHVLAPFYVFFTLFGCGGGGGGGAPKGSRAQPAHAVFQPRQLKMGITSQRLLDQSQAGVYMGKTPHTPPFGPIRVPYPKGLNC